MGKKQARQRRGSFRESSSTEKAKKTNAEEYKFLTLWQDEC